MAQQQIDQPDKPVEELRGNEHVPEATDVARQDFENPLQPKNNTKTPTTANNNNNEFSKEPSALPPLITDNISAGTPSSLVERKEDEDRQISSLTEKSPFPQNQEFVNEEQQNKLSFSTATANDHPQKQLSLPIQSCPCCSAPIEVKLPSDNNQTLMFRCFSTFEKGKKQSRNSLRHSSSTTLHDGKMPTKKVVISSNKKEPPSTPLALEYRRQKERHREAFNDDIGAPR